MSVRIAKLEEGGWLKEQYVELERTSQDIADEIGCHQMTVRKALRRQGIPCRRGSAPMYSRVQRRIAAHNLGSCWDDCFCRSKTELVGQYIPTLCRDPAT